MRTERLAKDAPAAHPTERPARVDLASTARMNLSAYARRMDRDLDADFEHEAPTTPVTPSYPAAAMLRDELPSLLEIDVEFDEEAMRPSHERLSSAMTVEAPHVQPSEVAEATPPAEERASAIEAAPSSAPPIPPSPSMTHVPYLLISKTDVGWIDADVACLQVAEYIDGEANVQTLVARVGASCSQVMWALGELALRGVVGFR